VKERGERRARPYWSAVTTVLEGEITGPVVDFTDIAPPQSSPLRNCGMFEVRAHGVDFDLDAVHLTVAWSEFDDCTFRQRRRTSYEISTSRRGPPARPESAVSGSCRDKNRAPCEAMK
jgi:hypothetical protein